MNRSDFTDDGAFKYIFKNGHELIQLLIEELFGYTTQEIYIENPVMIKNTKDGKSYVLDLAVRDEFHNLFDIEMQNTNLSNSNWLRFYSYGIRYFFDNIKEGDDFILCDYVYCIIFVKDKNEEFITRERMRYEDGQLSKRPHVSLIAIHYREIENIIKVKKLEELTPIELMCYIFNYGINDDIMNLGRKEVELMTKFYNDFTAEKNEKALQRAIMKCEDYYRDGKRDGRREGKAEGKVEGLKEGEEKGLKEATNVFIKIIGYFIKENRLKDLEEVINNPDILNKLIKEYSL